MRLRIHKQHFSQPFVVASYRRLYKGLSPISYLLNTRLARAKELLGNVNGLDILDVGCGIGKIGVHIIKHGGRYFAVDISSGMLRECHRTMRKTDRLFPSQATMDQLPFLDSRFDCVMCLGSMEYVDNIETAVTELSRVLQKDGTVIISMQNQQGIYRFWEKYVYPSRLFNWVRKLRGKPVVETPLEKSVTLRELRNVLSLHGLVVQDIIYYNFNICVKPLDTIFPRLSMRMSKGLEFLGRSALGLLLAADFIILSQNIPF